MRRLVLSFLLASIPCSSYASDGMLEINQTCATGSGCFPGDAGGFPVTISSSGSYLLTSDLSVSGDVDGIRIETDAVTLDMNGFRLLSTSSTSASANGIEGFGLRAVEIRNGTIEGFQGRGIVLGDGIGGTPVAHGHRIIGMRTVGSGFQGVDLDGSGHFVSGCTSVSNDLWGFSVDGDSLIIESVAANNGGPGMSLGAETGYRNSVISGNNGGNGNAQFFGAGVNLGGNLCGGDAICP